MQIPPIKILPSIALNPQSSTFIGSDRSSSHPLEHPLVAQRHVEIILGHGRPQLRDLGAGTVVNGELISKRCVDLQIGDEIEIGPFAFHFKGNVLESLPLMDSVQVTARDVCRTVTSGGQERRLLQHVSLVAYPGEFVCLLGPSGCGKSTLIAALSGRSKPDSGQIALNHRDLYTCFEWLKKYLVLVPQEALLHYDLTMSQALGFTARMRLPSNTDRQARVNEIIKAMLMEEHRGKLIKQLSIGQQKRVSLANEMLADPRLIFLDEVTSGLDDDTDSEMMRQFRGIADSGRTVICITHNLTHVMSYCQLVVFLTPGGRLAYFGPPHNAIKYFRRFDSSVNQLGDVYRVLTSNDPDTVAMEFKRSRDYSDFLKPRLPDEMPPAGPARAARSGFFTESVTVAHQTLQLVLRQLILLGRDLPTLASLLGQVLLVALILIMVFGKFEANLPNQVTKEEQEDKDFINKISDADLKAQITKRLKNNYVPKSALEAQLPYVQKILNLTFLMTVISFWLGCNNAAREIVREKAITDQERYFNLRPLSYFLSKVLIQTAISWLQVGLLIWCIWIWCAPPIRPADSRTLLLALAFAGTTLGLFLSAISTSERVAVLRIPLAIIPQIILSGAIVKLTGLADVLANLFITSYWGKQGMDALVNKDVYCFASSQHIDLIKRKAQPSCDPPEVAGEIANRVQDSYIPWLEAWLSPLTIILIHSTAFMILTLAALQGGCTVRGIATTLKSWLSWPVRKLKGST